MFLAKKWDFSYVTSCNRFVICKNQQMPQMIYFGNHSPHEPTLAYIDDMHKSQQSKVFQIWFQVPQLRSGCLCMHNSPKNISKNIPSRGISAPKTKLIYIST